MESLTRFRGAGYGVREGVPLMRHKYVWRFAQAGIKSLQAQEWYYKRSICGKLRKGGTKNGI